ncbi:membrane protein [Actinorhabdospora filicis]|uniref:Membrane protein n=1 Tax=Actinorhabdospora filicis TaxID=1785913 RepID=A0A9W6SI44_9ACTN|nr:thioredoxin domain-containing protein [Actinorhabdospora filicis]GLZ76377.1 membrane protein [Actinorhabdospora filicis]
MNRLASSLSPYLQQHAANPVDWREWSEETLAEAKALDKPLFISVGYAACHWCHVMAHESFEDAEIAALVNEFTVPVKVDREERPDVDAVYMQATIAIAGQGGWPMTVFAAPDGTPFFAGTYFPREHFARLVNAVGTAWATQRSDLMEQGKAVVQACATGGPVLADVSDSCPIDGPCPAGAPIEAGVLDAAAEQVARAFDRAHGGFGGAPKFPTAPVLDFLLRQHARTGEAASLMVVERTAEAMARGGIYDQLGGGYARYSVDAAWVVPHFEKMLYDNALLLDLHTRLDGPLHRRVAGEVARFIVDGLGTAEGGFASAFDADTDGVEGLTYVWTPGQLLDVLGEDAEWAARLFEVTQQGTFEHGASVLQLLADPDDEARYARVRDRLRLARDARPQPGRDDKVVAAWNALAVTALTEYARVHGQEWADRAAERAATLLHELHTVDGRLRRVSRDGTAGAAAGVLEDYGATAVAYLARHRATGEAVWLDRAKVLVDVIDARFATGDGGFHDTADDAEALVSRPSDPTDGPTPSGWALAARAYAEYAETTGDPYYRDAAYRALAVAEPVLTQHPRFAGGLGVAAEVMRGHLF